MIWHDTIWKQNKSNSMNNLKNLRNWNSVEFNQNLVRSKRCSPTKSRKDGRCPYIPDYRTDPWSLESGVLNNECLCGQSELRQMSERARDDLSNGGPEKPRTLKKC